MKRFLSSIAIFLITLAAVSFNWQLLAALLLIIFIFTQIELYNIVQKLSRPKKELSFIFFTLCYGLSLYQLLVIYLSYGTAAVFGFFLAVWCVDIFAMLFGKIFGGPLLLPSVSPNKTWAGLLGAVTGASIVFATFMGLDIIKYYYIPIIFAGIAQAGDFTESLLKRHAGVKDSGDIIPGHGGMMDRYDGIIFSVFYYSAILQCGCLNVLTF